MDAEQHNGDAKFHSSWFDYSRLTHSNSISKDSYQDSSPRYQQHEPESTAPEVISPDLLGSDKEAWISDLTPASEKVTLLTHEEEGKILSLHRSEGDYGKEAVICTSKSLGTDDYDGTTTTTTIGESFKRDTIPEPNHSPETTKRFLQLTTRRKIWILSIFITFLVLVSVTVALGVLLGRPHKATSNSPVTTGHSGIAAYLCPSIDGKYISSGNSKFKIHCSLHYPNGSPALNGNGTVRQIGSSTLVAYSLAECMAYCVEYNDALKNSTSQQTGEDGAQVGVNGSGCLAVTYAANLTAAFEKYEQNCFLKDRIGVGDKGRPTTETAVLIST